MQPKYQKIIQVLRETRDLLALPRNDFVWSSWEDAFSALKEIDGLIFRFKYGHISERSEIEFLYAPTGPIQEVSLSSGWGDDFIKLADKFDSAIKTLN